MESSSQVVMLDLKSIICAGYSCILHLQAMAEEVRDHLVKRISVGVCVGLRGWGSGNVFDNFVLHII